MVATAAFFVPSLRKFGSGPFFGTRALDKFDGKLAELLLSCRSPCTREPATWKKSPGPFPQAAQAAAASETVVFLLLCVVSDNAGGCTWSSETYHTTLELNHHAHSVSHRERATARSELSPQPMQFGTSVPSLGPSRKIQSSSPAGRSRRPDAALTSANVVACEPVGRASSAARSAVTEVDFRVARAKRQRCCHQVPGANSNCQTAVGNRRHRNPLVAPRPPACRAGPGELPAFT